MRDLECNLAHSVFSLSIYFTLGFIRCVIQKFEMRDARLGIGPSPESAALMSESNPITSCSPLRLRTARRQPKCCSFPAKS